MWKRIVLFATALVTALVAALGGLWIYGERGRLFLPSTRAAMQRTATKRMLTLRPLHAYLYARWTNQYIRVLANWIHPRLGERGRRYVSDHYHGKVLTTEQAEKIIRLDRPIERQDLEQVIPYPLARDLLLDASPDVIAYECGCRHRRPSPCQPTQVCMIIGKPFTDFMLEHNPQTSRRLTQAEALQLLREEHERGHLHSAWFKDVCEERFYAICNCCKCCCGGIEAMMKYGNPMIASSGYVAEVDEEACIGCGACETACPFEAIHVNGVAHVTWEACMGCGVCEGQCKTGAVTLVRDEAKGLPLDVTRLQATA